MRKRKAQSILEYIIVLSAIVAAVLVAVGTSQNPGVVRQAVDQMYADSTDLIQDKTSEFYESAAGGGRSGN